MVQFIFVRHGESTSNEHLHLHALAPGAELSAEALHAVRTHANPVLTWRGTLQSSMVANHITRHVGASRIVAIVASPFARAHETARAAAHPNMPPIRTCDELREYTTAAKWASLSESERTLGDADTWPLFTARVAASVALLERDYGHAMIDSCDGAVVLVYGHSIHISTLLTHVATQCVYMPPSIDALAIELPNCSVSVAHYHASRSEGARWSIYKAACACHLEGEATGRHTSV